MALRLRRGTDAERLAITPAAGELIYTTDTKKVYIGDGTTVGGNTIDANAIQSIDSLQDVDTTSTPPSIGWTLTWDGSNWVPDPATGVIEGSNYNINIIADDSTTMVNTATKALAGTFTGASFGSLSGIFQGDVYGTSPSVKLVESDIDTLSTGTLTLVNDQISSTSGSIVLNDNMSAPVVQPTAFADTTARDAAIPAPVAGMVVFVTDIGAGVEALQVYKTVGGWTTIA